MSNLLIDCENLCDRNTYCDPGAMEPNPADCSSYYMCSNYEWVEMQCGNVTVFDYNECLCIPEGNCIACPTTPPRPTMDPDNNIEYEHVGSITFFFWIKLF